MADFQAALAYTLENEGGYSDDPADSGGPTNLGLTLEDLRGSGLPATIETIRNLTPEQAAPIYEVRYWTPLLCAQITDNSVATAIFDIGVLRGIGVPPRYAQLVLNDYGAKLAVDGVMGPLTLAALNLIGRKTFLGEYEMHVASGFQQIVLEHPSQEVFLRGWLTRARRLLTLV
jgi:lysozyme family protein